MLGFRKVFREILLFVYTFHCKFFLFFCVSKIVAPLVESLRKPKNNQSKTRAAHFNKRLKGFPISVNFEYDQYHKYVSRTLHVHFTAFSSHIDYKITWQFSNVIWISFWLKLNISKIPFGFLATKNTSKRSI